MNELFEIFEKLGLPYFRQGSLSDDNYPNSFFTFWNIDTPSDCFYDNEERCYKEIINVYFYTNNPKIIYSKMDEFIKEAKLKGFIVEGHGKDTSSGKIDYFGRYITITIIHR